MKQLVLLSGKGGTGKTSVTAAFAHLASQSRFAGQIILADTDVDAANLELVLEPRLLESQEFQGGKIAVIDNASCTACGRCEEVCRFDAINFSDGRYVVDPVACDGCAACVYQCPAECITMQRQVAGTSYVSKSRYGPLHHAGLLPGQENSGKLVTLVKQRARLQALEENRELTIADGPPGIGCPVISATSGADLALVVAEPTIAGVHDMRRAIQTVQHFGVRPLVCINKADIYVAGTEEIEAFCRETGIEIVGNIPFDTTVTAAMVAGKGVTAFRPESPASVAITAIWRRIVPLIQET